MCARKIYKFTKGIEMTKGKILNVAESENESAEYSLWEIKIKDKVKYAIYVSAKEDSDFELFNGSREHCEHLFNKAVAENLSPIHLEDIATDIKRELYEAR